MRLVYLLLSALLLAMSAAASVTLLGRNEEDVGHLLLSSPGNEVSLGQEAALLRRTKRQVRITEIVNGRRQNQVRQNNRNRFRPLGRRRG